MCLLVGTYQLHVFFWQHDTIYGNSNLYFNQTQIICHTDLTQKKRGKKNMSERQQQTNILLQQKKNKVK